jgi:3-oxoacyl-[acyl-carrier protein] reductase
MRRDLKEIRTSIYDAKHVCLFGVGISLGDCFDQLVLAIGREPDFLCDNAQEKWGKVFFGVRCISPQELAELREETVVVIAVKRYEGIYAQLNSMGIRNILVACYDRSYNSIHSIKRLKVDQSTVYSPEPFISPVRGKWTLITGAARGVGYRIALEMAKLGSNIIAHSRSLTHVKELVAVCSGFGVQVVPVAAELSNLTELDAMLSNLERVVPQIDIIFNNAAISLPAPSGVWSASDQDYLLSFTVNTIAPIRICYRLIPPMIKRGFGRVINISSSVQKRPDVMAYSCSKAALDKFIYELAYSLQDTGVMVTLVDPGWLRSDMGGPGAPHPVESVVPGALLGALLDGDVNGRWFSALDYSGLSIEEAIQKAKFIFSD